MPLLHGVQQLEPREPRHADVRNQHLGGTVGERLERVLRGGKRVEGDALAGERFFDHPADGAIVVDDPDRFHASGNRILNMVRPGRDSNSMTPWWYWTYVCASESPKPVPPSLPDTSGLKMRSCISAGTPGPSSITCNSNARRWRCLRMVSWRTARVRKLMCAAPACAALRAMLSTAWMSCRFACCSKTRRSSRAWRSCSSIGRSSARSAHSGVSMRDRLQASGSGSRPGRV